MTFLASATFSTVFGYILGALLILSFIALVIYCVKGHNLMVGFFVMTVVWVIIALIGFFAAGNTAIDDKFMPEKYTKWQQVIAVFKNVFQDGPGDYGKSTLVNVIFGAFFGRVLVETNIASTMIRKVVELGGDKPRIILFLLSIVTALLFTSLTGIGPVISIAVIILPILLTLGIPTPVALFSFLGSIMAGIFANSVNVTQYIGIFIGSKGVTYTYRDIAWFGWIALCVALVFVIIVTNIALSIFKKSHAWAAKSPQTIKNKVKMKKGNPVIIEPEDKKSSIQNAPFYSWLAILLPVILIVALDFPVILAFIIAALYALITCRKLRGGFVNVCRTLAKLVADGTVDVAPMIGFLLAVAMFNNAAAFAAPYLSFIQYILPTSALGIAIFFAVLAPLGHFRGPLNLVGCGAALLAVFASVSALQGYFDAEIAMNNGYWYFTFGFGLFLVTTIAPQHVDITLSWVAWSLGYTKVAPKDLMKMTIPTAWMTSIVMVFVLYFVCHANGIAA